MADAVNFEIGATRRTLFEAFLHAHDKFGKGTECVMGMEKGLDQLIRCFASGALCDKTWPARSPGPTTRNIVRVVGSGDRAIFLQSAYPCRLFGRFLTDKDEGFDCG